MFIVVMQKIKDKMMQLLRMLFVLAILIILVVQLWETVKSIDMEDKPPQGDAVRVELNNISVYGDHQEAEKRAGDWFNGLLNKLKNYHRGE
ncbi:hypothetical protein V6C27_07630 [Peptococcaceae bacterium 1198_IL3148]